MAALVTQADLEMVVTPATVAALFSDDGGPVANEDLLTSFIDAGSRQAEGLLYPGFQSPETIATLVSDDSGVRLMIAQLVIGLAATRRPGLLSPDGSTPLMALAKAAKVDLERVGRGLARSIGESGAAGRNRTMVAAVRPAMLPVFRASGDDRRGPGGF